MKPKTSQQPDDMRPEYAFDYSKAVRGKYYKRILKEGANVVVLEPDVARAFPSSAAVNDALRVVLSAGRAEAEDFREAVANRRDWQVLEIWRAVLAEIFVRPGGHPKSPSCGHFKIPQLSA